MLTPYNGTPIEADPIILIIDGSELGLSALIIFTLATIAMIARANLSARKGLDK